MTFLDHLEARDIYPVMEHCRKNITRINHIQEVVFVETDSKSLKKLYSNYFLDVRGFVKHLKSFLAEAE